MLVWFPFYLNPAMYLAPVVVAWYGTTMPYVGFMYGNWEANALMNIIDRELEPCRASAALDAGQLDRLSLVSNRSLNNEPCNFSIDLIP